MDSSRSSNVLFLQFSFASKTRLKLHPEMLQTSAESKEMGIGFHLIATAGMTESWGLILALSFLKRAQRSKSLHFGIFWALIRVKVVFPPTPDSSRCHQSPPCSKGGRMQWEAGRDPALPRVPALRAGPGARSQSPAVGIWCVYLQSNNDPGTARRMSQLPVQGRIPHQASKFKKKISIWRCSN